MQSSVIPLKLRPKPMPPLPTPWPELPLDPADTATAALLANLQGNVLQGHGRDHARLVFWRCDPQIHRGGRFWTEVIDRITTAAEQKAQALNREKEPNTIFRSFALTAVGMRALGVADPDGGPDALRYDPRGKDEFSDFNAGMKPPLPRPANAPAWMNTPLHGVWIVACKDESILDAEVSKLVAWGATHGLVTTPSEVEPMTTWRNKDGLPREPFGFADGISVPTFFVDEVKKRETGGTWSSQPLTQVLIRPGASLDPLHIGGTFLVVQKIEQNTAAFDAWETTMRPSLRAAGLPAKVVKEPGALLVGRHRDGRPLVDLNPKRDITKVLNAFDFESDGRASKCPFHAHIRRMNPRAEQPVPPQGTSGEDVRKTQLVRRGMIYDPEMRLAKGERPTGRVGLMFMAYTSCLLGTFSELVNEWAKDPLRPVHAGPDPILAGAGVPWSWPEHRPLVGSAALPQFVTPLGGEFFYVPAMPWLLAQTARP
jgi:hypothetical protein